MVMVIIIIVWSKQAVLGLLAYESCFKRERGREEHWSMLWIWFFFGLVWFGLVWFGSVCRIWMEGYADLFSGGGGGGRLGVGGWK
jgi:hypothetical protein